MMEVDEVYVENVWQQLCLQVFVHHLKLKSAGQIICNSPEQRFN